jgi:hypothetical protein
MVCWLSVEDGCVIVIMIKLYLGKSRLWKINATRREARSAPKVGRMPLEESILQGLVFALGEST